MANKNEKITIEQRYRQTLQMYPDRIVVREIRGEDEAASVLNAIMNGHSGTVVSNMGSSEKR